MNKALIQLFNRIGLPASAGGEAVAASHVKAFNKEVGALGYTFDGKTLKEIRALDAAAFGQLRGETLEQLAEIKGASKSWRTLFNKFPYETPDHDEYLNRRIIGYMQHHFRFNLEEGRQLSCGHFIESGLFDPDDFGVCPICQFEVDELEDQEQVLAKFKSLTPLTVLSVAGDDFMKQAAARFIARPSSLSAEERKFILALDPKLKPAVPARVTRENLPLVFHFHGAEGVAKLLSGATDVLRIAALVTNPEADLSLAKAPKFKLKTRHKKALLQILETLAKRSEADLLEDMMRRREMFLRLGERLNPASAENARRWPLTAAAFARLRNAPEKITTFNRIVHKGLAAKKSNPKFISTLASRPGEFMRRIDALLRNGGGEAVLEALHDVVEGAPLKLLFEVKKYLETRAGDTATLSGGFRAFMPKGASNKMKVIEDTRAPVEPSDAHAAAAIIADEIAKRLAKQPKLGTVYLDPELKNRLIPVNRRGDSATASPFTKGSRYPMGDAEVIRLFVWWKGHVDIDLSAISFDAALNELGHVSFTNLRDRGMKHSGDIRNAPNGAAEFIDFDVDVMRQRGIRYVVSTVHSFRGDGFKEFPCFAGFMERDGITSGRKFEPESVKLKFNIETEATDHMTLIFDFETRQVIFADLTTGTHRYGRIEAKVNKLTMLLRGIVDLTATKPTAFDVLSAHAKARGKISQKPEKAKTRFMADDLDLEAVMVMMSDPA